MTPEVEQHASERFKAWVSHLVYKRGFSQRQVSELTGLSHAQVGKLSRGEIGKVRASTIRKISKHAGIDERAFFRDAGPVSEIAIGADFHESVEGERASFLRDALTRLERARMAWGLALLLRNEAGKVPDDLAATADRAVELAELEMVNAIDEVLKVGGSR